MNPVTLSTPSEGEGIRRHTLLFVDDTVTTIRGRSYAAPVPSGRSFQSTYSACGGDGRTPALKELSDRSGVGMALWIGFEPIRTD